MLLLHVVVQGSMGLERLVTYLTNLSRSVNFELQVICNLRFLFCSMVTS